MTEEIGRVDSICPVCLRRIAARFKAFYAGTDGCNLQLSGGEPTMRADLPEIIGSAKSAGFAFVQLNTNGLRLAAGSDLAAVYRDAGLSSIFLQFDGICDQVYNSLRGRALWAEKQQALKNLARAGLGVVKRRPDDLDAFLARAREHTFSISAMAFQDIWNLNLERLQGCCVHIAPADGGLVPFCAYNLTAIDGRALH